jgi:4-carboxymuconolactone decarboxylase
MSTPARLTALAESEWTDAVAETVRLFGPLNVVTTLARHPRLASACSGLGGMLLFEGALPAPYRELVILRTAYRHDCIYIQEHHVPLGLKAGLTMAQIHSTSAALADFRWPATDRVVLTAVDELCDTCTLGDRVWQALAGRFSDAEVIELVVLTGYYRMLAATINALRIPLEDRISR